MAMGSNSPADGRSGVNFQVQLQVSWNAPEAYVNLDSDGAYKLKTVPDVLGLHARQPAAAVIEVFLGHDSRSVRALAPDVKVRDRGFHKVTLLDMGYIAWPDASIADLSILRLQWPVPVISGMARLQPELEQLRHVCKKRHCGTQTCAPFVGRRLSWTCPDTLPTITWNSCSYGAMALPGVVVYHMERYATRLYGPLTSGTCSAFIR